MDHEGGRISESSNFTDQGYQTLMKFTFELGNSIVDTFMVILLFNFPSYYSGRLWRGKGDEGRTRQSIIDGVDHVQAVFADS